MAFTDNQRDLLDQSREVLVETHADDGRSTRTIIWIVVVEDDVYVRSVRGEEGHWYQRVLANPLVAIHVDGERIEFRASHVDDAGTIEAVDHALREKYPAGGSLDRMTREEVLGTTLRLDPID
jgi:hypothetical protein